MMDHLDHQDLRLHLKLQVLLQQVHISVTQQGRNSCSIQFIFPYILTSILGFVILAAPPVDSDTAPTPSAVEFGMGRNLAYKLKTSHLGVEAAVITLIFKKMFP
uniref:Uncharacterized protein n=1 Tax=Opuntia streptacantha TaxID=393608 RepID=A0A7C8YZN8_OPUST